MSQGVLGYVSKPRHKGRGLSAPLPTKSISSFTLAKKKTFSVCLKIRTLLRNFCGIKQDASAHLVNLAAVMSAAVNPTHRAKTHGKHPSLAKIGCAIQSLPQLQGAPRAQECLCLPS